MVESVRYTRFFFGHDPLSPLFSVIEYGFGRTGSPLFLCSFRYIIVSFFLRELLFGQVIGIARYCGEHFCEALLLVTVLCLDCVNIGTVFSIITFIFELSSYCRIILTSILIDLRIRVLCCMSFQ